jgi:hypothetical protein
MNGLIREYCTKELNYGNGEPEYISTTRSVDWFVWSVALPFLDINLPHTGNPDPCPARLMLKAMPASRPRKCSSNSNDSHVAARKCGCDENSKVKRRNAR